MMVHLEKLDIQKEKLNEFHGSWFDSNSIITPKNT
jgi:hypothetical protein